MYAISAMFEVRYMFGGCSVLCFLLGRGAHFQKIRENKLRDSEKWSRKTLDGRCDGYVRGLDGAENLKCWFFMGFTITC